MKIVSHVYSESGKALLGVGQAVLIATAIAKLFSNEPVPWWAVLAGFFLSLAPILVGLALIQRAYYLKKDEEKQP
jgi:ABC-type glycerol-3-phosphate transport system permease component